MELSNVQHERFAQCVANGLSLTESAKRAGYKESAAANMGSRVASMRQVSQRIEELKALTEDKTDLVPAGIRSPQGRVAALADRWERMRTIIAERAGEYTNSHRDEGDGEFIAGGKSGLLIKQVKQIGSGDKATIVTSYVLDRELLAELRAHEQQAAEELGQWATRKETFSQNLSLSMDTAQLHKYLTDTMKHAPAKDRAKLLAEAPELAELVGEIADAEPEAQAAESTPGSGV